MLPNRANLRRASARFPFDGAAQLANEATARCFEITDVSVGGIAMVGDTRALHVGSRVVVTLAPQDGPRLVAHADIRRINGAEVGLAWWQLEPAATEQLLYLVADAARTASSVPEPIGIERAGTYSVEAGERAD